MQVWVQEQRRNPDFMLLKVAPIVHLNLSSVTAGGAAMRLKSAATAQLLCCVILKALIRTNSAFIKLGCHIPGQTQAKTEAAPHEASPGMG